MSEFSAGLSVLPIKPDTNIRKLKRPINPILPDVSNGQTGLFIGKIKSGKSVLLNNFYLRDEFYGNLFDSIYIISNSIYNDSSSRFLRDAPNVNCYDSYDDSLIQGIIDSHSDYEKNSQPLISIVADDILGSLGKNAKLFQLFTRSRHYNIGNLVILTQMFKAVPPAVRNNLTYLVLFWNNFNESELDKINDEYGHFVGGRLLALYKEHILYEPYAFMYINFENGIVYKNFDTIIHQNTREYMEKFNKKKE